MSETGTSGAGLRRALRQHGLAAENPQYVPSFPATDGPMIITGVASAPVVDCTFVRLCPRAFGALPTSVPLLFEHKPDVVAGTIHALDYDGEGALLVRARVVHPEARRRAAFSVSARVLRWEMREHHADVLAAELCEVSMVSHPVNPLAIVRHRWVDTWPAEAPHYDLLTLRVERLLKMMQTISQARA